MICRTCGKAQRDNPVFCRDCGDRLTTFGNVALPFDVRKKAARKCLGTILVMGFIIHLVMMIALPVIVKAVIPPRPTPQIHGVVVGVSDYLYLNDLRTPAEGASQIRSKLQDMRGKRTDLDLLADSDATFSNIEQAMHNLALREDAEDIVLFYFTGHGNASLIAPYDKLAGSYANAISTGVLDRWLDALDSKRVVVVIDSCHAGGFITGLAQQGRVIIASCGAQETCWREFSDYLVRGLSDSAAADTRHDGGISVEELYKYCCGQLRDQHPVLVDDYFGELVLASI